MNSGPLLFLGLFFTMACSWVTFVMGPQLQLGNMQQTITAGPLKVPYPVPPVGSAAQGASVYRANGCAACHTEQVQAKSISSDIARGWGIRPSVGYDYVADVPVMIGNQRIGPDLANVGLRLDQTAFLLKLYDPQLLAAGKTIMPSFRYLFETRKIGFAPATNAMALSGALAPPAGYEVVPTRQAEQLAAYLSSLRQNEYVYEAPPPFVPTNAAAARTTNAPMVAPLK